MPMKTQCDVRNVTCSIKFNPVITVLLTHMVLLPIILVKVQWSRVPILITLDGISVQRHWIKKPGLYIGAIHRCASLMLWCCIQLVKHRPVNGDSIRFIVIRSTISINISRVFLWQQTIISLMDNYDVKFSFWLMGIIFIDQIIILVSKAANLLERFAWPEDRDGTGMKKQVRVGYGVSNKL